MTLSDTVTATDILTAALVCVTIFYAWATYHILKANKGVVAVMQEQLEQLNRPYVQITTFIRPGTPLIALRIQNTGKTAALNLKLDLDRDFHQFGETGGNLRHKPAFQTPISSLPPSATLEFALGLGHSILPAASESSKTPNRFTVRATYSFFGKSVVEDTGIDLSPYLNSDQPHDSGLEGMREIRNAINALTKILSK